ncbi:hypothetical protein [Nocardia fluminea]|uniref:Uncharacterized protein n=1 Tax=Nocardia fluminea TaxID=134984 RepID=A0A2N3V566_9NOCA|nr:hypothetical protein [Nocardia fluminea]PKV76769.1 hypothetical protein ATK86_7172 [Nocardia fluminea]
MREMKNTQSHDEDGVIKPGAKLSGNDYVLVTLRDSGDPSGRILLVRKGFRCIHGCTICVECAESWELDHHVHYQQTGGGRRLREALNAQHPAADNAHPAKVDSTEPGTIEADSYRQ